MESYFSGRVLRVMLNITAPSGVGMSLMNSLMAVAIASSSPMVLMAVEMASSLMLLGASAPLAVLVNVPVLHLEDSR